MSNTNRTSIRTVTVVVAIEIHEILVFVTVFFIVLVTVLSIMVNHISIIFFTLCIKKTFVILLMMVSMSMLLCRCRTFVIDIVIRVLRPLAINIVQTEFMSGTLVINVMMVILEALVGFEGFIVVEFISI